MSELEQGPSQDAESTPGADPKHRKPLLDMFMEFVELSIDDKGFYPQYGMAIDDEDKVEMACIVEVESCHMWMLSKFVDRSVKEAVFAIDRHRDASPRSVGLTYDDFLTIVLYNRGKGVTVGICEYVPRTKQMQPIDWGNKVWNEVVKQEFLTRAKMARENFKERQGT